MSLPSKIGVLNNTRTNFFPGKFSILNTSLSSSGGSSSSGDTLVFSWDPVTDGAFPSVMGWNAPAVVPDARYQDSNQAFRYPDMETGYVGSPNCILTANANDPDNPSNVWLRATSGGFPAAHFYRIGAGQQWGSASGKGRVKFRFMTDEASWAANRLLFQLNNNNGSGATAGLAIRSDLVSTTPGLKTNSTVCAFFDTGLNTPKNIELRWNLITSNTELYRTRVLYVTELAGTYSGITRSIHESITTSVPADPDWHLVQFCNDTTNQLAQWQRLMNVYKGDWTFDLPVNIAQDFNTYSGTIDATMLEASDYYPLTAGWGVGGTLTALSVPSAAFTLPATYNLHTMGGRVLRRDMTATTAGGIYIGFTATSTVRKATGFCLRFGALADSTKADLCCATNGAPANQAAILMIVELRAESGVHYLRLRSPANGDATSSDITVSPGTDYAIGFNHKGGVGGTAELWVWNLSTGTQVGSKLSLAGPTTSVSRFYFYNPVTAYTAQSSGVIDLGNMVFDNAVAPHPLLIPYEASAA